MAKEINFEKHLFEGWTVGAIISEIEPCLDLLMDYQNINYKMFWNPVTKDLKELKKIIANETPYKKKAFPDVVAYFKQKYSIK